TSARSGWTAPTRRCAPATSTRPGRRSTTSTGTTKSRHRPASPQGAERYRPEHHTRRKNHESHPERARRRTADRSHGRFPREVAAAAAEERRRKGGRGRQGGCRQGEGCRGPREGAGQGGRQLQEERRFDGPQEVANSGGEEREKGTSGCPSFLP